MKVSFETINPEAKVWIYQADRMLTQEEVNAILEEADVFISNWAAHGKPLQSAVKIYYHRFLVLAVDEAYNLTSGCSIDASVHFIKELESRFQIDFFNRQKIAFLVNGRAETEDLNALKEKIKLGVIKPDSMVFNNLVDKKTLLESQWLMPAGSSWMARFFQS